MERPFPELAEFFAALNEPDLMPAAGPAVAASNADGGRFHEYTDASLMDGVERLGGLDPRLEPRC